MILPNCSTLIHSSILFFLYNELTFLDKRMQTDRIEVSISMDNFLFCKVHLYIVFGNAHPCGGNVAAESSSLFSIYIHYVMSRFGFLSISFFDSHTGSFENLTLNEAH